ncbi:MAG: WbuC family cupin fold metalloprotein [Thioalkalispiraceae bacterium]|jgi:cupin fold WbuC family metalloprotein
MTIKLDDHFFQQLLSTARQSPRKRSHFNLHQQMDEPVQRLCIGLIKGTYVRPHHHPQDTKWELMLCLKGRVCLITFHPDGHVLERLQLAPGESITGIELSPNSWHSVFPLSDEAVILEVKQGPYTPANESDFASWSPKEGDAEVRSFLAWLEQAQPGDRYQC